MGSPSNFLTQLERHSGSPSHSESSPTQNDNASVFLCNILFLNAQIYADLSFTQTCVAQISYFWCRI